MRTLSQGNRVPLVVVASHNPVKVRAVQAGFASFFPELSHNFQSVSVPSGVSMQPLSDAETLQGAENRVRSARETVPTADFWVGIEGGAAVEGDQLAVFAWVVVQHPAGSGRARTATFFVPPAVAELVRAGKELGEADDLVFGRTNSKQENGAVGILTGDAIDRTSLYAPAVVLALIPFRNPQYYFLPMEVK